MPLINSHRVIDINKGFFICVPAVTNIQNAPFCYRCSFLPPLVSKWTNSIYQRAFRAVESKPHRGSNHIEVLLPQAVATNRAPLLPLWLARVATCQELLEMVCTDCALLPTFFSSRCSKKKKYHPQVTQQSCLQVTGWMLVVVGVRHDWPGLISACSPDPSTHCWPHDQNQCDEGGLGGVKIHFVR